MRRLLLLLTFVTIVIGEAVHAQPPYTIRSFNIRDGLAANQISNMEQDSRGLLWIATWNGLCCYDGYQFTTFNTAADGANLLTTNRINRIRVDSLDNVWVETYDGNIYRYDTHTCRYQTVADTANAFVHQPQPPSAMIEANHGDGWRLTPGGQLILTDSTGQEIGRPDRLPLIEKHYVDRQGNLWLMSAEGLSLVNFHRQRMQFVTVIPRQRVRSVCCRRDGTVWAGTMEGYVAVSTRDGRLQGWLTPQGQLSAARTRFSERVYALYEDSQHQLWIGTKGHGLFLLGTDGRLTHCLPDSTDAYSLNSPEIYDFDETPDGRIWIATFGGGVNVVNPREGLRFLHRDNSPGQFPLDGFEKVRRITHTANGLVIASTTRGLLTLRPGQEAPRGFQHQPADTASLRTNDVMQTLVTADGTVYVATFGGGIQQLSEQELQSQNPRFVWAKALNRASGNVLSMTEDRAGNIWIAREMLLQCYQPASGQVLLYGSGSNMGEVELAEARPVVDDEGRFWHGAMDGMLTFAPQTLSHSAPTPSIVFTTVAYQDGNNAQPLLYGQHLTLDPTQRSLTIGLAAIDFGDRYLIQYAYRLDGKPWNYIGTTPRISFSELSPGSHVLTVRSTNSDGVWVDNETELLLEVTPMLWERTWFRLLMLLLAVALATYATLAWLRHRQQSRERDLRLENILRQYRELQEQVNAEPSALPEPPAPVKYQLEEPRIVNEDEEMMGQLMSYIEQHISEEGLRPEDMASALNLGRTAFYNKIKQLVGVSPVEFLRQVRMQRAMQLMARSGMTVAEVAYAVGFSDPKYFSKCFKKETGLTPSLFREQQG